MQKDRISKNQPIVLTNAELAGIELAAIKAPSKDGSLAPRLARKLLEYINSAYGIDLGVITEEMENEEKQRIEREAKERSRTSRSPGKLARKSSRRRTDDF